MSSFLRMEIISPDERRKMQRTRPAHSTVRGCPLGWLIDPGCKAIEVGAAGREPARLGPDDALGGEPVLPGFRLPVAEVFGWRKPRL